jgi:hypothetical protein
MRELMGWQGEGRFTGSLESKAGLMVVLGLALVWAALAGCAQSGAAVPGTEAMSPEALSAEAASPGGSAAPVSPGRERAAAASGESPAPERVVQRLSPAEAERAQGGPGAPELPGSETITPRHVEAELNRLEAELAN